MNLSEFIKAERMVFFSVAKDSDDMLSMIFKYSESLRIFAEERGYQITTEDLKEKMQELMLGSSL